MKTLTRRNPGWKMETCLACLVPKVKMQMAISKSQIGYAKWCELILRLKMAKIGCQLAKSECKVGCPKKNILLNHKRFLKSCLFFLWCFQIYGFFLTNVKFLWDVAVANQSVSQIVANHSVSQTVANQSVSQIDSRESVSQIDSRESVCQSDSLESLFQ